MITHLSYSAIDLYATCPLKYKLKYIDKRPEIMSPAPILGKAFHKAMEVNFLSRLETGADLPLADLQDAFSDEWDKSILLKEYVDTKEHPNEVTINWAGEDKGKVKSAGLALVKRYYRDQVPFIEPAFVEEKYVYPVDGAHIRSILGYVDLVTVTGKVIDYKTVNYPWTDERVHVHMQPTFYALLMDKPCDFEFHFIVKNSTRDAGITIKRSNRTAKDIAWLKRQLDLYVRQIEFSIENDIFPASPGQHCTWCDYTRLCGYRV